MAYSEALAERVRDQLGKQKGLVEKKMFGGLAFLLNGNMSVGVSGDELIVRLPPDQMESGLGEPGARPFEVGGRQMKGWLLAGGAAIDKQAGLKKWIGRGITYASSLPAK